MRPLKVKKEAVEDLRFLLSRGYDRSASIRFVGDKYLLNKEQRLLLYRAVYPESISIIHKSKLVNPEHIENNVLLIDGFNILWTVISAIKGQPVYLCDDGIVRDLSEIHGAIKHEDILTNLRLIISFISQLKPENVIFFFEQQISRSGEIAAIVRKLLNEINIEGEAKTVQSPDYELISSDGIVATSDSIIIEKAKRIFDFAGYIIKKLNIKVYDLSEILI
ncbi:MAG: DUF434 domain-containing protein [Candidatus Methanomethyliaceae archaeon]|nr:DUF434 domain-containing protein [Candidatus Methanomethyliaceae archaeon]MDW7970664.1 DUF434 domain-containing protein [Nitrososphaerota archaeon]